MPEELKQLLAGLAAAASNGDAEVKIFSEAEAKEDPDFMNAIGGFANIAKRAMLTKEITDHIKDNVIEKAVMRYKAKGLPKEEMLDFVIYCAVATTMQIMEDLMSDDDDDDDDDDEDEDCDCDACSCSKPTPNPNPNPSAASARDVLADILAKKVG